MPTLIRCDGCGLQIEEDRAIFALVGEETLYFCSPACEAKQKVPDQIEIDEDEETA
jgi:hypothetical protein